MSELKYTSELILVLKFVIRVMKNPTRDIIWAFLWILKNFQKNTLRQKQNKIFAGFNARYEEELYPTHN